MRHQDLWHEISELENSRRLYEITMRETQYHIDSINKELKTLNAHRERLAEQAERMTVLYDALDKSFSHEELESAELEKDKELMNMCRQVISEAHEDVQKILRRKVKDKGRELVYLLGPEISCRYPDASDRKIVWTLVLLIRKEILNQK